MMPREQPRRPKNFFTRVKRVEQQQAERIKGGCICPGGSIWVLACGGRDNFREEQQDTPPMQQVGRMGMSPSPSPPRESSQHLRPQSPHPRPQSSAAASEALSHQSDWTAVEALQVPPHEGNKAAAQPEQVSPSSFRRIFGRIKRKFQLNVEWDDRRTG